MINKKKAMSKIYFKFNVELMQQISNIRQAAIISFLVNQEKEGEELRTQKWQQTYLADIFNCEASTIWRDLKQLKENGWLDYEQTKYNNSISTKITLSEKALKYRVIDKNLKRDYQRKEHEIKNKTNNHQANISEDVLTTNKVVKISRAQQYLNYINKSVGL